MGRIIASTSSWAFINIAFVIRKNTITAINKIIKPIRNHQPFFTFYSSLKKQSRLQP